MTPDEEQQPRWSDLWAIDPTFTAAGPWDACLDVDPFTGQPEHDHGDSCEGCE